ncbi:MAG: hypothetical protein K2W95_11780 [Candidatus Obscuribacterales bacterium]|nr:hypothetical protein [Candidatus Obscuribacterales bacterium]
MAKRILIETSILALFCVSCLPGQAQDTAGKKKVALGPTGMAAPRVVRSGSVPVGFAARSVLPATVRKSYPASHLERGLLFKQQGRVDDALLEFLLSVQENPAQVRAFYEQAEIFKQKGKPVLAQSALEQALAIAPGYTDARTSLMHLHVQAGNLFGAASEMGRMLGITNEAKPVPKPAVVSSAVGASQNASAKTGPGVPGAVKTERKPAAKAEQIVSRIVSTPTAELHAEQPAQEIQDPAQAIASWLAPEQSRKAQEDQGESKPAPSAVSHEALPGATPSFDAVAASLGLLPQQKDSSTTTPELRPVSPATDPSARSASASSVGTVNGAAVPALTSNHPGALPGSNAGEKGSIFGRTMTALMHPPVPRVPHLFGGRNDSGAAPPSAAPLMVPKRPRPGLSGVPVAGWMKNLSNPLRSSGGSKPQRNAAPNPSNLLSANAATPSAVTITRIATPAEDVANQRDQPSSPEALSPQLQKMLAAIMPPQPAAPPAAQTQTSGTAASAVSQSSGSSVANPLSKAIEAASPSTIADAAKDPLASVSVVPLDNRPKQPYGLLQSNAASRTPDLMGETVIARNAAMAAQPPQESWMGNMMKKASALMPKMPNLPKLPEMPHFSMPVFLGGQKDQQTAQAVASSVVPVAPASPVPVAAPADLRVIPADVRNILSKVEGARAIDMTPSAAEVPVSAGSADAVTAASLSPPATSRPASTDGTADVVKNRAGGFTPPEKEVEPASPHEAPAPTTGSADAAPVVVGVVPPSAVAAPRPGIMDGLPDVVKNILGGFTPPEKQPEPAPLPAAPQPADAAPLVVGAVPPAAVVAPRPGIMDGLPDVVKNILGGFTPPEKQPEPESQPATPQSATGSADAAPVVVDVVPPSAVAAPRPGIMDGLPDVVKNIVDGFTPPEKQPEPESQPATLQPATGSAEAAPVVVAVAPPALITPATSSAPSTAPDLPPVVQSAVNAAGRPAAEPVSAVPASSYSPPKAPGPTPVDMQGILSKLSMAIPQQAASFFHLKKNGPAAPVPKAPGGINVSSGMIQPVPGSAVKHAPLPPSAKNTHSRAEVIAIPPRPIGLPHKDVPEALPSVVKDVLNKVDVHFVPTVVAAAVPGQYVPTPVQLEKGTGEGPQPIASAVVGVAPTVPAPALPASVCDMFANVPVPEMRPKAPTPVPVNVQAILGKIPTADPGSAKLSLKQGAAALLPHPTAVKLPNGEPVVAAAPSAQVDVQSADVQALHPKHTSMNVMPGQVAPVQPSQSLPVLVRDVLRVAEKYLPPSVSAPAAATRAFVVEPMVITREEVQGPTPIASSAAPFSPAAAPAPVGADLSKHFSGVVPEVRPQVQPPVAPAAEGASPVVAQNALPQTEPAAIPASAAAKAPQPYSGPKLTNAQRTRSGAFTYMHPVLDTDRLFGTGQLRTIPAAAAKTEKPKAPPPPPEDAITKRMRYLLANGTQNLKPGEAFMFSEETGEGILFMPGGGSERRKLTSPQDHEQVLQTRRPDILEPKDLQYSLSLLGKLLPPQQEQRRSGRELPIESGPTLDQIMDQTGKGFFGWVKGTFKFGGK